MDQAEAAGVAADLWHAHGYDGCQAIKAALTSRMAEHRATVAEERRSSGLSRPRSSRKMTRSAKAALLSDSSESSVNRLGVVLRLAPDLLPLVETRQLSVWAAYKEARSRKQERGPEAPL